MRRALLGWIFATALAWSDDRLPNLPDYESWDAAGEGNSSAPR